MSDSQEIVSSPVDRAIPQKRIPVGTIKLALAGEIIVPRNPEIRYSGLFKRYQLLFESLANFEPDERRLAYRMMVALILTSYAKKTNSIEDRKNLYEMKNGLYLMIANDVRLRSKVRFRYLTSSHFRIIKACEKCAVSRENTPIDETKPGHTRPIFCDECQVDRKFYNILLMRYAFPQGYINLFLSNDQIQAIHNLKIKDRGKLADFKEEARFEAYQYNVRNLDVFAPETISKIYQSFLNKPLKVERPAD